MNAESRKVLLDLVAALRRVPALSGSGEYRKGYLAGLNSAARMANEMATEPRVHSS